MIVFLFWSVSSMYEDCQIVKASHNGKNIFDAAKSSFDVCHNLGIDKLFGVNETNSTFPSDDPDKVKIYAATVAGFSVVIAITLIIELLFFIGSQIASYWLFKPTNESKYTIIGGIVHILCIILMFSSVILFCVALGYVNSGAVQASKLDSNTHTTFDDIILKITQMKNVAFFSIRELISTAMYSFHDFVDYIKVTFANIQTNAFTAKAKSQEAASYSGNSVNGLQFYANNVNVHYMTCAGTTKELIENDKITKLLQNLNEKISALVDNAYKLPEMSRKIQRTIDEVDNDVSTKVDEYDEKFNKTIDKVDFSKVYKITEKVEEYSQPAKAASNTVTIFGIIFSVMIIATYTIIYFMTGKWCKCLSCWFPTFAFAFAIFLGVPAIFFSFLVVFFEGSCPHMDTFVENIAKDSFSPNAQIMSALYCAGVDKSLYSLLDLEAQFDVNTLLHQFNDTVKNEITKVESDPSLVKTLDQVAAINTSQFSLDGITEIIGMKEILKLIYKMKPGCRRDTALDNAVDDYFDQLQYTLIPMLQEMMNSVVISVNYAKKIGPEIKKVSNYTINLVSDFISEFNNTASYYLYGQITCDKLCTIYVPLKNTVCANVVDGGTYWLISSVIMVFGSIAAMFSLCIRRRNMGTDDEKNTKEVETEVDSDSETALIIPEL